MIGDAAYQRDWMIDPDSMGGELCAEIDRLRAELVRADDDWEIVDNRLAAAEARAERVEAEAETARYEYRVMLMEFERGRHAQAALARVEAEVESFDGCVTEHTLFLIQCIRAALRGDTQ